MVGILRSQAFRTGRDEYGRELTPAEREELLRPYLPQTSPEGPKTPIFHHKQRVRPALKYLIYNTVFSLVQAIFTVYITIRQVYHALVDRAIAIVSYHHRTPELIQRDVKTLKRLPKHLSIILELPPEGGKRDRLETLISDACEVAAWTASAGIPTLSIYERTGILKSSLQHVHRRVSETLDAYFGANSPIRPTISLRAPNLPSYSPPHSPNLAVSHPSVNTDSAIDNDAVTALDQSESHTQPRPQLNILLIDSTDGRQTLVDLTKTLADMSQQGKMQPADVSDQLIDAEISESVMGEPDLLIIFSDRVILDGYPPWQVRLTEIFHVQDNSHGVGYHVFVRALYKYAQAQFRVGK